MSEFISSCPKCRQRILCDTQYAGKRIACPLCLQEIVMPEPPAQPQPIATGPAQFSPGAQAPSPAGGKKGVPLAVVAVAAVVVILAAAAAIWYFNGSKNTPPVAKAGAVPDKSVATPTTTTPARPAGTTAVPPAPEGNSKECRALWTFDQDSGTTAADGTGNGYQATLVGNHAHWTKAAKIGSGALSLGGASYAETAGPVVNTMKSFTVAAWVYVDAIDRNSCHTLVSIDGSEVSGFYLQLNATAGNRFVFNRMEADADDAAPIMARATADTALHTWYHVAGVYDANAQTLTLYVNGKFQETVSFTKPWQAMGRTAIGRGLYQHGNRDFVKGMIDEVRFYAAALTPGEIKILAAK